MRLQKIVKEDLVYSTNLTTTIPIASTATVYTAGKSLGDSNNFTLGYKFTSDGAVNVQIEIQQSDDNSTYVTAEDVGVFDTATDETQHFKAFSPLPTKYFRLKLTGQGANDSSTTLAASLQKPVVY